MVAHTLLHEQCEVKLQHVERRKQLFGSQLKLAGYSFAHIGPNKSQTCMGLLIAKHGFQGL